MSIYLALTLLIGISAAFAYINHRFIRMPFVIGLFFLSTIFSLLIVGTRQWDIIHYEDIRHLIEKTDISGFILNIMLGFMLFAGSLHTNWLDIKSQAKPITFFAVVGVIVSTAMIGGALFWICRAFDAPIDLIHCLIFGALISPTDPIAVLGILTKANVPKKVESTIVGESLFNDGVGVVVFIALLEVLQAADVSPVHFGWLFIQEAIGGVLFGLGLGVVLHRLLRSIDNYEAEVLLTLAFVMGGYSLANYLHLSGALAMVIMGLFVGNYNQKEAMSDHTLEYVNKFWKLLDVILNAMLFIMIAFVLLVIELKMSYLVIGALAVGVVLLSRAFVVLLPVTLMPKFTDLNIREGGILVWGGLRGGLSIALVLSLPESEAKELLTVATYTCVVVSILLQGLTIERLAKRILNNKR